MRFNLLTLSLLLLLSCDDSSSLLINPLDEESSDYEAPETTITTEALDGTIIETSSITITFTGNELVAQYSFNFDIKFD